MKHRLPVTIRFAEPEDLDFCVKKDYKHVSEAMTKRNIEENRVILAEIKGKPIGYLRLEYWWLKFPFLSIVSVEEKYQRKGVGTAMIKFLEDYLSKKGHGALYSSTAESPPWGGSGPQRWHKRIGFEECGYIAGINKGGIGEILFRKFLTATIGNSVSNRVRSLNACVDGRVGEISKGKYCTIKKP